MKSIEAALGEQALLIIKKILDFSRPVTVCLVGGTVRDALLGWPLEDLDFSVEGDACALAESLKMNWSELFRAKSAAGDDRAFLAELSSAGIVKVEKFRRYGTAKLVFDRPLLGQITVLDFASTRKEIYPQAGQAPRLEAASLIEDLFRRDFSINALALSYSSDSKQAQLIDPSAGVSDLERRELRILHPQSFRDDPARLLRGARFFKRFGLHFEKNTHELFKEAIRDKALNTLPRRRLFEEFVKVLKESAPEPVLEFLLAEGLLAEISPQIRLSNFLNSTKWQQRLLSLLAHLDIEQISAELKSFALNEKEIARIFQAQAE